MSVLSVSDPPARLGARSGPRHPPPTRRASWAPPLGEASGSALDPGLREGGGRDRRDPGRAGDAPTPGAPTGAGSQDDVPRAGLVGRAGGRPGGSAWALPGASPSLPLSNAASPGPRALPCEAPGWPLARGGASTQPPAAVAGRGAGSLAAQPQSLQARSLWLLSRANKGAHVRAVCSLATVISYQLQRLLVLSPFFQLCPGRRSSESKGTCARHSFSFKRSQTLGGKKDQIFLFLKEGNVLTYQETITS